MQLLTPAFGVPPHVFASLSATRATPDDIRLLRAGLHSRRLVLLKSLLAQADRHAVPQWARQRLARHWRLLERAEARDPAAARDALDYPAVGNWLLHALSLTDRDAFADFLAGFGAVAAAVALRTGTGFRLTLEPREGRLTLPGVGVYETRSARVRAVAGPRSLRLTPEHRRAGTLLRAPYSGAGAAGWRPLRRLPGGSAVLDDLDPHRAGPLPPSDGAAWDTGAGTPEARARDALGDRVWRSRWSAALTLLQSADPERAAEVSALVRAVVPMARRPGAPGSATLRSAPGGLLAKLPCSAWELAVVLVHEAQHSKLAVLTDLVPLVAPGSTAVHRVAWRPDPRPLDAVLHGTYAHLALADLWQRLSERRGATPSARAAARARSADYHGQVAPALAALRASGELTPAGASFTEGMRRQHARLARRSGYSGYPQGSYPQASHVAAS